MGGECPHQKYIAGGGGNVLLDWKRSEGICPGEKCPFTIMIIIYKMVLLIDQNLLMILLLCLRRQTLLLAAAAVCKTVKRIIKRCKVLR